MNTHEENKLKIAMTKTGDTEPTSEVLVGVQADYEKVFRVYVNRGLTEKDADTKAWAALEKAAIAPAEKMSGIRAKLTPIVKEYVLGQFKTGQTQVSANEVYEHLKVSHGYKAKDAKGIGDLLGRHGLRLEPGEKVDGKKTYLIPDPDRYPEWHENGTSLPASYYSEKYFDDLVEQEVRNPKSKFFSEGSAM